MGVPLWLRENFRGVGAKTEYVPVPVLVGFELGWALAHKGAQRACRAVGGRGYTQSRWPAECDENSPVGAMLARIKDFPHEIQVLVFFVSLGRRVAIAGRGDGRARPFVRRGHLCGVSGVSSAWMSKFFLRL